jgi:hypothetical protein
MIRRGVGVAASISVWSILSFGAVRPAMAVPITYEFSGVVTFHTSHVAIASQFSDGQLLSGTYTVESTTDPRTGSTSNLAFFDGVSGLSFQIGSYSGSSPLGEVQVHNNLSGDDEYRVSTTIVDGLSAPSVGSNILLSFALELRDTTETAFLDALLLPTSLNLSSFDLPSFTLLFDSDGQGVPIVQGTLTDLRIVAPAAVPGPIVGGGLPGLLLAFGGFMAWWQRKRTAAVTIAANRTNLIQ